MFSQDAYYGQTPLGQRYRLPDYPAQPPAPASDSGQGPYPPPTNPLAILALALAFACWPLALVFGHLAHKQITRTGERGRGLATAGLVIGYLFLTLVLLIAITVAALAGAATEQAGVIMQ
ncbi:MAG: DUF4190 domain-containing protein [Pseudonocardiaceae bacterium]